MAWLFCWLLLLALACFCADFFWFDFGERSPMALSFFYGLTHLRHVSFSEGTGIVLLWVAIVNDEHDGAAMLRNPF